MNIRQAKYKSNRLKGMNQYNAARSAGYSESYAHAKGKRLENVGKIGMADAFEQAGLTDKAIVNHALEGLQATKVISANITYGDADEKTNDFIDVPDWGSRHKYLSTICEMTDRLKKKVEHSGSIATGETRIIIVNNKEESDRLGSKTKAIPATISI